MQQAKTWAQLQAIPEPTQITYTGYWFWNRRWERDTWCK